jgi:DNA-binding HxlR family transcriptional regulator
MRVAFISEAYRSASRIEAMTPTSKPARPGTPVRGSKTGRPIMALLDLLGRRWTLRVLWELRSPADTFRDLQSRCDGMSSSVLSQRLADLREAGIVEPDALELTAEGAKLLDALGPLDGWAKRWARRAG